MPHPLTIPRDQDNVVLTVDRKEVRLTNLRKMFWTGAAGAFFFMKRAPAPRPAWIETCAIDHGEEKVIDFPMIQDRAALKMPSVVKTTGSKGLHVYVPIVRGPLQQEVRTFAHLLAQELARRHPALITAEYRVAKRPRGRVLVDYNQNRWGSTLASIYSVRPRPEATVSTPVTWKEVEKGVRIEDFTVKNCTLRSLSASICRMPHRVTRREFIGTAVATTAIVGTSRIASAAPAKRPNVLFILADDLGYGDLSCYGRPDYRTPVLDAFAKQGIKFMSAYAAAPICTPTRCAYITGRYPQRLAVGLEEPLKSTSSLDVGLPPNHPTVASLLKNNGYTTALVGKWHLGWKPEFGPNRHGFEEFFGILTGAADYFTHRGDTPGSTPGAPGADLWENLTPVERVGYLTDLLSDRAVQFLARPHDKPFFLSLQYNAPHSPWEGPEDEAIGHTTHGRGPMADGGSLKIYGAMMKSMDSGIGRVLKALERAKLERDTLVIFTSDNGGERYSFNWPFSFAKGYLWEGGTRVPAMVRWPGTIPAGQVTEQAAITMDWTATILGVTGTAPDPAYPLDGENLMPVCTGQRGAYDRTLFWRTVERDAARVGNWKYLKDSGEEYLFDLAADPGEKADLRRKQAGTFEQIKKQYLAWNAQMLPKPKSS